MSMLRLDRVERAPSKRLQMLLHARRRGEEWPPIAVDVREAIAELSARGVARLWIGVEGDDVLRPVPDEELADLLQALEEALGSWPVPVAVRIELFEPAGSPGDDDDGVGKIAVFTLRCALPSAA